MSFLVPRQRNERLPFALECPLVEQAKRCDSFVNFALLKQPSDIGIEIAWYYLDRSAFVDRLLSLQFVQSSNSLGIQFAEPKLAQRAGLDSNTSLADHASGFVESCGAAKPSMYAPCFVISTK